MAMIAPTVDSVGDAALTNSLIDRSITELQDNIVASLTNYALHGCTALKKVAFGSVTSVAANVFQNCTALEVADFHQAVAIADNAFFGCKALKALILRSTTQCTLSSATGLNSTGISAGTGYIYVPSALVETYKADSKWSTYAGQIRAIEEWPEVCEPYSWEAVEIALAKGTYKDVYKIGDSVPVDLGSEGVINMQIAAFDADTLADGSGTAAISWVAKELLKTKKRFNPALVTNADGSYQEGTGGVGGWEKCEMRTYLQSAIKPMIPGSATEIIQSVVKTQRSRNAAGTSVEQTTHDEVWVPTSAEASNTGIYSKLFPNNGAKKKCVVGTTNATNWWSRYASSITSITSFGSDGSTMSQTASNSFGICLGFCTGRTPA